jgi:hypothetical protein
VRWSGQNMCYCRFSFHCTLQKWDKDFLDLDELNPMVWVPSIFRRMIDFSLAVFKLRELVRAERAVHPYHRCTRSTCSSFHQFPTDDNRPAPLYRNVSPGDPRSTVHVAQILDPCATQGFAIACAR